MTNIQLLILVISVLTPQMVMFIYFLGKMDKLSERIDKLTEAIYTLSDRVTRLEVTVSNLGERVTKIENRLDTILASK